MVSSLSGAGDVFRALELGAIDFVQKPQRNASPELKSIRTELVRVVEELPYLKLRTRKQRMTRVPVKARPDLVDPPSVPRMAPDDRAPKPVLANKQRPRLVVLGASTGGPTAIESLLRPLPADFPCAILIAQHMPAGFTKLFADRLDRLAAIDVAESKSGIKLRPGAAFVCAGGVHTIMDDQGVLATIPGTENDRYVPSVDRTMAAAASVFGADLLGILLTGMGDDGKKGMLAIDRARGMTVAESEETSLVFGMPERAISAGAVDLVLRLEEIEDLLMSLGSRRGAGPEE
jgi:two-component system chemotaxis response regulator CheB